MKSIKKILFLTFFGLIFSSIFFNFAFAYSSDDVITFYAPSTTGDTGDDIFQLKEYDYVDGYLTLTFNFSSGWSSYNRLNMLNDLNGGQYVFGYKNGNYVFLSGYICQTGSSNEHGCYTESGEISVRFKTISYLGNEYTDNSGITKTFIDSHFGSDFLENGSLLWGWGYNAFSNGSNYGDLQTGSYADFQYQSGTRNTPFPITSVPPIIDGVCGDDNGTYLTTAPTLLCSSGIEGELYEDLIFNKDWRWTCYGLNGGTDENCVAYLAEEAIDGVCGTENGQSVASLDYDNLCSVGWYGGSVVQTFDGWTWSCYGFNDGAVDFCSATNTGAEIPPELPDISDVPTPTDCSVFSGIDAVLCNFGNTIQGFFLPSTEKMVELQTAINKVGNVFPFNYLRAISNIFSNVSTASQNLTMTIWGQTETLTTDFLDLPFVEKIRDFFTILLMIGFLFWGINYIKHFF